MTNTIRYKKFILSAVLAAISFAVYASALKAGFFHDDVMQVVQNSWIRDFKHIPDIFGSDVWGFSMYRSNYYRPMMHLLYSVDYHLFGLAPWGYHLINVLFHCASAVAVFYLIAELLGQAGRDAGLLPPFLGAALFAVHPINTESVTWVACLPEVAFAFFYFLSFYIYVKTPPSAGRTAPYALSGSLFFLAALSKETALTLPLLIAGYEYGFRASRPPILSNWKRYLPYAAAAAAYLGLRINALGGFAPHSAPPKLDALTYAVNVPVYAAYYFEKLLLPMNLKPAYVFHPVISVFTLKFALSLAVVAVILVALARCGSIGRPVPFLGLILVLLPLLPVVYASNIGGEKTFYERYLYVPSFGLAMLAALPLTGGGGRERIKRRLLAALLAVLGLYAAGTVARNELWTDELAFWADAERKSPDSVVPHGGLGLLYGRMGDLDRAEEEFRASLAIDPGQWEALNYIGVVYTRRGDIGEAKRYFEESVRIRPDYAEAHYNLGMACEDTGEMDRALHHLEEAVRFAPFDTAYSDELARARAMSDAGR